MDYKLRWSQESIRNLEDILDSIKTKWNDREVNNFKSKLSHQIYLISQNLFMFPVSTFKPGLRKAVLSKQTTIFYQVADGVIYLAYIHLNRKNLSRIK